VLRTEAWKLGSWKAEGIRMLGSWKLESSKRVARYGLRVARRGHRVRGARPSAHGARQLIGLIGR